MMGEVLYTNALFHTGRTEDEVFECMSVARGKITGLYHEAPARRFARVEDLAGRHVYPCLIDGHVHLLLTVAVMAMGFSVCEITDRGVEPNTMAGVAARIREYAAKQRPGAVIAMNNFILTAVDEHRMPTKAELDDWGGGRPVVVYNIDGHSTSLSTAMLKLVGLDPTGSGVLQGEENERAQGRIIDAAGAKLTASALAKGVANFQNACAEYGIARIGALEGNGDSPKDVTTALIAFLARHFDVGVRMYPQYTDLTRAAKYRPKMKHPRVGGCGDWEMDGASGSHSAAFHVPYSDTGTVAPCYYSQEFVDELVTRADREGYQIASHAIGEAAIERLLSALEKTASGMLHRVEHGEFMTEESYRLFCTGKYALMMQPGYAWIDKRYLHTYEQHLPQAIRDRMRFRSLVEGGVCVCGSSDSPVQDLDPWLQMLGMTEFYNEAESVTPYQAFRCYTANAARALLEEEECGTLEVGKDADFFAAEADLFAMPPRDVVSFRPTAVWYGGKAYKKKKGTLAELLLMLLKPARKI